MSRSAALSLLAAAFASGAFAAPAKTPDAAQARYQSERAVCMQGLSNQDKATCLKEAAAALQEARRGQLTVAQEAALKRNRLARCNAQQGADREDCVMRMEAGTTSGTAQSGGILRESSRTISP